MVGQAGKAFPMLILFIKEGPRLQVTFRNSALLFHLHFKT